MTIEKRLENLERELARAKRRGRWLLGVMLLVVGLFAIGFFETMAIKLRAQGAGREKEIRANKFILVDEMGKTRALLCVFEDDPKLTLFGKNNEVRALLAAFKDQPTLALYDENGEHRALLNILKDNPILTLLDRTFKPRVMLSVFEGNPGLKLFDENGKVIWSAIK